MVMIYPDDEARAAGLSDFRTGGVRGDWVRLGIVLPIAMTLMEQNVEAGSILRVALAGDIDEARLGAERERPC